MEERWRAVIGWEDRYQVSDQGRVRGKRGLLVGGFNKGYPQVTLWEPGRRVSRLVHHLVLEAFVGPCPPGMQGCHYNDIRDDNRLKNLRWDTPSANQRDCVRNGNHPMARKTHCPKGHAYAEHGYTNGYDGSRNCRICQRIRLMTPRHIITCEECGRSVRKPKKTTRFCSLSCSTTAGNRQREENRYARTRSEA